MFLMYFKNNLSNYLSIPLKNLLSLLVLKKKKVSLPKQQLTINMKTISNLAVILLASSTLCSCGSKTQKTEAPAPATETETETNETACAPEVPETGTIEYLQETIQQNYYSGINDEFEATTRRFVEADIDFKIPYIINGEMQSRLVDMVADFYFGTKTKKYSDEVKDKNQEHYSLPLAIAHEFGYEVDELPPFLDEENLEQKYYNFKSYVQIETPSLLSIVYNRIEGNFFCEAGEVDMTEGDPDFSNFFLNYDVANQKFIDMKDFFDIKKLAEIKSVDLDNDPIYDFYISKDTLHLVQVSNEAYNYARYEYMQDMGVTTCYLFDEIQDCLTDYAKSLLSNKNELETKTTVDTSAPFSLTKIKNEKPVKYTELSNYNSYRYSETAGSY